AGAEVSDNFVVGVDTSDIRGVSRAELHVNGRLIETIEQVQERYTFRGTGGISDGILNIEVRAFNDLEAQGTATVQVQQGAPCSGDESCKPEETCEEGACVLRPPSKELGEPCTSDFECVSGLCPMRGDEKLCSQFCNPFADGTCPTDFECIEVNASQGVC